MATLLKWIEDEAAGEPVEGVVLGEMGWGDYGAEDVPGYAEQPRGTVMTWETAKPFLQYSFSDGHGAPGCNALTVWTATKVTAVYQYDGATSLFSLPRNPTDHMPDMPGG